MLCTFTLHHRWVCTATPRVSSSGFNHLYSWPVSSNQSSSVTSRVTHFICPETGCILKISFSRACCWIQCVGSWKVTKAAEVVHVCVCVCPQEAATECPDLYRFSVFSLQRSTTAWRCGQITTSSCVNRSSDWQPPNPNGSITALPRTTVQNGLRRLGLLRFHWREVQDVEMSPRQLIFTNIIYLSFTHKQNVFLSGIN